MSDIADDAEKQIEQFTLWAVRNKKPEGPLFTGFCANCGEMVPALRRWCDTDCRDDEQQRLVRAYGNT